MRGLAEFVVAFMALALFLAIVLGAMAAAHWLGYDEPAAECVSAETD